jgi:Tfp pilus assembly protein PilN
MRAIILLEEAEDNTLAVQKVLQEALHLDGKLVQSLLEELAEVVPDEQ